MINCVPVTDGEFVMLSQLEGCREAVLCNTYPLAFVGQDRVMFCGSAGPMLSCG